MTALVIPRDPRGEIIYPGSIRKEVVADFMFSTSLPSWLTNVSQPGSSLSISKVSTMSMGHIDMISNNNAVAQMALSETMYMQYWGALRWDLEGVYFNAPSNEIEGLYMSLGSSNVGAVAQLASPTDLKTRNPTNTSHFVNHHFTNRGTKRSNVSLLVFPRYKQVYLMENDQVVAHINDDNMVNTGVITPNIGYKSAPGYNNKVSISQIRFTCWGNG